MGEEKAVQKRAVCYARTSQDSEDAGLKVSIEDQLAACRNLCQTNNYKIIGEYQDRNRSGRTYPTGSSFVDIDPIFEQYFQQHIKTAKCRTRNGLGELFKKLPHVDVLVVRDETRLMRPLLNSYLETYIWQTLSTHKVIVHSVTSGIVSPDNHEQQMISRLKASATDKDVSTKIKDSKTALDHRRNNGDLYYNPCMFGFTTGGKQKVITVEHELQIVKRIFSMYLKGELITAIAKILNAEGLKTKNGAGWCDAPIRHVLSRIIYAGYQYNSFGDVVESRQFKPHALVTLEDFYRVKERLGKRELLYSTKHTGRIHPVTGLVFCGTCGYRMRIFQTRASYYVKKNLCYYYICMWGIVRNPSSCQDCRKAMIRETYKSQLFRAKQKGNGLLEFVMPLLYTGLVRHLIEEQYTEGMDDDIIKLEGDISRIDDVEKKLLGMNLADQISDVQFANLMKEYKGKRAILKSRLSEIREHVEEIKKIKIPCATFQNLRNTKMTAELVRDLCHKAFSRIDVFPNKVAVSMANGGQFEIDRMDIQNGRPLPYWKVSIDSPEITLESRIEIQYFYKSPMYSRDRQDLEPVIVVYEDKNLKVVTVGKNGVGCYREREPGAITGNVVEYGVGVESNLANSKIDLLPVIR